MRIIGKCNLIQSDGSTVDSHRHQMGSIGETSDHTSNDRIKTSHMSMK